MQLCRQRYGSDPEWETRYQLLKEKAIAVNNSLLASISVQTEEITSQHQQTAAFEQQWGQAEIEVQALSRQVEEAHQARSTPVSEVFAQLQQFAQLGELQRARDQNLAEIAFLIFA